MKKQYQVICSSLHVRTSPSIDSPSLGFYHFGKIIISIEDEIKSEDGRKWIKFQFDEGEIRYVCYEDNVGVKYLKEKIIFRKQEKKINKEEKSLFSINEFNSSINNHKSNLLSSNESNFSLKKQNEEYNTIENIFINDLFKNGYIFENNYENNYFPNNFSEFKFDTFSSNNFSFSKQIEIVNEIDMIEIKSFVISCNKSMKMISDQPSNPNTARYIECNNIKINENLNHKHERTKEKEKNKQKKGEYKHSINATDNLRSKIKNLIINYIRKKLNTELNNELKNLPNDTLSKLEESVNKNIKLLKNRKEKEQQNIAYYNNLLRKPIKEIFSSDIIKDGQFNKEHNKILIEKIFELYEHFGYFKEISDVLNKELSDFVECLINNYTLNVDNNYNFFSLLIGEIKKILKDKLISERDLNKSFKFFKNHKNSKDK